MTRDDRIQKILNEKFSPKALSVENLSHHHQGHAGYAETGDSHFRVYIVADAFSDLSRIARHQLVYAALSEEINAGLHALIIETHAPAELNLE